MSEYRFLPYGEICNCKGTWTVHRSEQYNMVGMRIIEMTSIKKYEKNRLFQYKEKPKKILVISWKLEKPQ